MTRVFVALSIYAFSVMTVSAVDGSRDFILKIGARSRLETTPCESGPNLISLQQSAAPITRKTYPIQAGPWGELEYYIFHLQNPNVEKTASLFSEEMYWCFPGYTESDAFKKLEKIGINRSLLQRESYILTVSKELRIVPTSRLIRALTPDVRAKLRMLLRHWPDKNPYYAYPVVIESGDPDGWYSGAGLSSETISLISSLCYIQRGATVFSDVPYVLSHIFDPEEKERFLKALFRTRTLMLRLTINEQSDMDLIRSYWTLRNQRKEVVPIFDSISETRGVEKLDVIHLLPPAARKRLYTFPALEEQVDCHATSLEFCGIFPDIQTVRSGQWVDAFKTYLTPAKGDLCFGDVIVLFNQETDKPIHSAIYIAGDILFTKNGLLPYRPWSFMFWSDILSLYGFDVGIYTKVYRKP